MKAEENMSETLNPTRIMIEPFFTLGLQIKISGVSPALEGDPGLPTSP